jgi:DNA-binding NtrC family response regulator
MARADKEETMSSNAGRILIADDDDTFLETTAELLRREGFDCDGVSDAAAAAALLSDQEYDLLIADIRMPGNENLELIRQQPQIAQGLPVILITGYPSVATAIDSIHLAVSDYVLKPIEFDDLLLKVKKAIASYRAVQAVRRLGQRLETWRTETALLEKSLAAKPATSAEEILQALAKLAYGRAAETLSDVRESGVLVASLGTSDADCAVRLNLCQHAIKDTIAILERTKASFKSKELGALRSRLQDLLSSLGDAEHIK